MTLKVPTNHFSFSSFNRQKRARQWQLELSPVSNSNVAPGFSGVRNGTENCKHFLTLTLSPTALQVKTATDLLRP